MIFNWKYTKCHIYSKSIVSYFQLESNIYPSCWCGKIITLVLLGTIHYLCLETLMEEMWGWGHIFFWPESLTRNLKNSFHPDLIGKHLLLHFNYNIYCSRLVICLQRQGLGNRLSMLSFHPDKWSTFYKFRFFTFIWCQGRSAEGYVPIFLTKSYGVQFLLMIFPISLPCK